MYNASSYPYQIKFVEKEQRQNLPEAVKVIFYFTLKEHPISIKLIESTRVKYPEYFELSNKPTIYLT